MGVCYSCLVSRAERPEEKGERKGDVAGAVSFDHLDAFAPTQRGGGKDFLLPLGFRCVFNAQISEKKKERVKEKGPKLLGKKRAVGRSRRVAQFAPRKKGGRGKNR